MVRRRREPWVTRRKMVDDLTPFLPVLGLKKDTDEDWG